MDGLLKPLIKSLSATPFNYEYVNDLAFGAGEQGVFFIPQPRVGGAQVLFQDSAGTIPVTADGDPVGLMLDLSGNGNHASQSTTASKPTYHTDGGRGWLHFDGVDDYMELPQFCIGTVDRTHIVAFKDDHTSTHNAAYLVDLGLRAGGSNGQYWGISPEYNQLWLRVLGSRQWTPSPYDNDHVLSVQWGLSLGPNVSDAEAYLDGASMSPAGLSDAPIDTVDVGISSMGKSNAALSNWMYGRIYGMVLTNSLVSTGARHRVERLLGGMAGVLV